MNYNSTAIRKRPMTFEALKGQNFVVSTIKTAIETGHIAHSYLFSGPRGVGKTTSARLLAKALCCEKGPTINPCGKCTSCVSITNGSSPDVIEIDGASNTSVDDVRKIKEELMFPPQYSRYKIYIIDEVHMLSNSAFNALLKTIEEPPEWAIFIFATTELQKVPLTIQSRCQCFRFRSIDDKTISELIRNVAKEDNVKIDEESIKWISKRARGGARDAYTLFDQCTSFTGGNITFAKIKEELGITGADEIKAIFENAIKAKTKEAIELLNKLFDSGITSESFTLDIASYLRDMLLISNGIENESLLYNSIENYNTEMISKLRTSSIENALESFLNLYRNLKYSLNSHFEVECAVSRLKEMPYSYSNSEIVKNLENLKKALVDESAKINPSLLIKVQKTQIEKNNRAENIQQNKTENPTAPNSTMQNTEVTPKGIQNPFDVPQNSPIATAKPSEEEQDKKVLEILKTTDGMLYQVYKTKNSIKIENGIAHISLKSTYSLVTVNSPQNAKVIQNILNSVYGNIKSVEFSVEIPNEQKEKTVAHSVADFFEGRVL